MCVCKTATRRRRQMKLDGRYRNWRKSATAKDRRLLLAQVKERLMQARAANAKKAKGQ